LTVLITGAAGQDGVLLARNLIANGEKVIGACLPRAKEYLTTAVAGIHVYPIDLSDFKAVDLLLEETLPEKIYNLAGFSSVRRSWEEPHIAARINSDLPAQILSWCAKRSPATRFLQASSSEIFGGAATFPQSETTPTAPITPYGLSKLFAHSLTQEFRREYSLHASNAILFNHESPLRSEEFVTRQITQSVARISLGLQEKLNIGNTSAKRDWGWAPDYVRGMRLALEHQESDDYIFATGNVRSVKELIDVAFRSVGITDPIPYLHDEANRHRKVDPVNLVGDASKAHNVLAWNHTVDFETIIGQMVINDIRLLKSPNAPIWFENTY
jgi:GDPmannose 4,6-dehydratase